jgi:hypothetical protein
VTDDWGGDFPQLPMTAGDYARGRIPGRISTSRTFPVDRRNSADFRQPGKFAYEVFDDDGTAGKVVLDGDVFEVTNVAGTRTLVKALVAREAGNVVDLWLQRVPLRGNPTDVLHLHRDDARQFIDALKAIDLVDPTTGEVGTHVDQRVVAEFLNNPESVALLYGQEPERIRVLIASDEQAHDVIALAGRRTALSEFRRLLDDDEYFDGQAEQAGGPEKVWQSFFEANPWTLGIGLGAQLLTGWSEDRLEQTVVGQAVDRPGKRVDAFLQTSGLIRSLVFAEIKHHRTALLRAQEYRPGTWAPSTEAAGGVSQVQGTVQRAVASIGDRLNRKDGDGYELANEMAYLIRPRSFLVIGRLSEFVNQDGNHHPDKIRSFELFRRHLQEPELITFDELLARAEWIVEAGATPADV